MKCSDIKQDLAFVAEGSLDSTRANSIHEHCAQCASCQALLQEYQKLVSDHRATGEELSLLTPSRPLTQLRASRPTQTSTADIWKWLIPVASLSCIIFIINNVSNRHKDALVVGASISSSIQDQTQNQKPPSLLVYRNILETSGDEGFDRALNRDALRLLPPTGKSSIADLRNDRL